MSELPEMACEEFVEVVTEYLEGALSADDLERLERHLGECAHCDLYLEQIRRTLQLTGELREQDVQAGLHAEVLAVVTRWKEHRS